jgi:hypothetical protein
VNVLQACLAARIEEGFDAGVEDEAIKVSEGGIA